MFSELKEIKNTERYKLRQAAQDRVNELKANLIEASIYHGHREYVVQYWVQKEA